VVFTVGVLVLRAVAFGTACVCLLVGDAATTTLFVGDGLITTLVLVGLTFVAVEAIFVGLFAGLGVRVAITGGLGVAVAGGRGVLVAGGRGVALGLTGVFVGSGCAAPHNCSNVITTGGFPEPQAHPSTSPLRSL